MTRWSCETLRSLHYVGAMLYFRFESSVDCKAAWKSLDSLVL